VTTLLVHTCTHPPLCTLVLDGEHQLIRNEGETKLLKMGSPRALSRYRSVEGRCGGMMPFTRYVLLDERMDFLQVFKLRTLGFGFFLPPR